MNTTLVIALLIPWVFWGVLIGFLIVGKRSWIGILLIPVGATVTILIIAIVSVQEAFWASLILHFILFVYFLVSYTSFMLGERKKNDD